MSPVTSILFPNVRTRGGSLETCVVFLVPLFEDKKWLSCDLWRVVFVVKPEETRWKSRDLRGSFSQLLPLRTKVT